MAPKLTMLREVSAELPKRAAFLLRVIRKWVIPYKKKESGLRVVEMVLVDQEGLRIQATTEKSLILEFNDKIQEHGIYAFMNFEVRSNDGGFRPASHDFRFYFKDTTKIIAHDLSQFPSFTRELYNFIGFTEIISSPKVDGAYLFDVIGTLNPKDRVNLQSPAGNTSKYININLRDLEYAYKTFLSFNGCMVPNYVIVSLLHSGFYLSVGLGISGLCAPCFENFNDVCDNQL